MHASTCVCLKANTAILHLLKCMHASRPWNFLHTYTHISIHLCTWAHHRNSVCLIQPLRYELHLHIHAHIYTKYTVVVFLASSESGASGSSATVQVASNKNVQIFFSSISKPMHQSESLQVSLQISTVSANGNGISSSRLTLQPLQSGAKPSAFCASPANAVLSHRFTVCMCMYMYVYARADMHASRYMHLSTSTDGTRVWMCKSWCDLTFNTLAVFKLKASIAQALVGPAHSM